ncbi:MAG TPA: MerR family transcriptional regulator [Vicinamibacterales bacterium]|nr:MerR family transcriptional regulator [Vicinamibacterales bacterium]
MSIAKAGGQVYRIREFASLAGVTVRALHHYDRIGLLKPGERSQSGYRLYRDADFVRLEQIVVLKFLGLPLKDIARLVKAELPLADTLRRQRSVLVEKRGRLDAAIDAISQAEQSMRDRANMPDWDMFKRIVREIERQNATDWTKKYYSPAARAKVAARKRLWTPALQARVTRQWTALVGDVGAAIDALESPSGTRARALAARWRSRRGVHRRRSRHPAWTEPDVERPRPLVRVRTHALPTPRRRPPVHPRGDAPGRGLTPSDL